MWRIDLLEPERRGAFYWACKELCRPTNTHRLTRPFIQTAIHHPPNWIISHTHRQPNEFGEMKMAYEWAPWLCYSKTYTNVCLFLSIYVYYVYIYTCTNVSWYKAALTSLYVNKTKNNAWRPFKEQLHCVKKFYITGKKKNRKKAIYLRIYVNLFYPLPVLHPLSPVWLSKHHERVSAMCAH